MSFKHGPRNQMSTRERALARIYDRLRKRAQRTMSTTVGTIYLSGVTDSLNAIGHEVRDALDSLPDS